MKEPDDIDMTAAEFVLGTLGRAERETVTLRRASDARLDARIAEWERRLAPLQSQVPGVEPAADLLPAIEARIAATRQLRPTERPDQAGIPDQAGATIIRLERSLAWWRRAAAIATAAAAALLVTVLVREPQGARGPQTFVAVFQKDDKQPAFVMSIDLASRELTVRAVTADRQLADQTYQLWIVADQLGPAPRSLGLLNPALDQHRRHLGEFEPAVLRNATFGISIEQAGGSRTGRPAANAVHGRLLPATP